MSTGAAPWTAPEGWRRITTIDAHTAGEPLRVVTSGWPELPGDTMLAKRRHAQEHHDHLRRFLMLEPRGHADMYGCVLTPPVTEDGDVGALFLHNEGFSTMCGHGIIGLVTVGLEAGLLAAEPLDAGGGQPVIRIDTPAGRVTARARLDSRGGVQSVTFRNVPSFRLHRDCEVAVAGVGRVRCDIAFGGAFYAYVDAASLGLELAPSRYQEIIDHGRRIKLAVTAQVPIEHPEGNPDLNFLYGTIFVEQLSQPGHSRNVCVFADGEVDRCPTGTGVSGRAAIAHADGEIGIGDPLTIESLIGTSFEVTAAEAVTVGDLPAVIPEVTGSAWITGRHEFLLDPADPLPQGVLLR